VCEYKAADLASVADQLERLNNDQAGRLAGRLDLGRFGGLDTPSGAMLRWSGAARTGGAGRR
jgi:hypothetical protein